MSDVNVRDYVQPPWYDRSPGHMDRAILAGLAKAWEEGFAAASEAAGFCCGCNTYGSRLYDNPFSGESS